MAEQKDKKFSKRMTTVRGKVQTARRTTRSTTR